MIPSLLVLSTLNGPSRCGRSLLLSGCCHGPPVDPVAGIGNQLLQSLAAVLPDLDHWLLIATRSEDILVLLHTLSEINDIVGVVPGTQDLSLLLGVDNVSQIGYLHFQLLISLRYLLLRRDLQLGRYLGANLSWKLFPGVILRDSGHCTIRIYYLC